MLARGYIATVSFINPGWEVAVEENILAAISAASELNAEE
jgi:hypothetical protein